jgi:hypothetical protein
MEIDLLEIEMGQPHWLSQRNIKSLAANTITDLVLEAAGIVDGTRARRFSSNPAKRLHYAQNRAERFAKRMGGAGWDESKHDRDQKGRFASKGGGGGDDASPPRAKEFVGSGDRKTGAILSPSAREPGKWQVTRYDEDGFSGDTTYDRKEQALKELDQDGYAESDQISLIGQLAITDRFIKGTDTTKAIAWINELNGLRDNEGANAVQYTFREQGVDAAREVFHKRKSYMRAAEELPTMEAEPYLKEREKSPLTAMLTPYTPEKLRETGNKVYGTDGVMYMLSPEGDMQGVVNVSDRKHAGRQAVVDAIARGAKTLDCFAYNDFLPKYYAKFGFKETGRVKFDRQYAPANWDYDKFGEPDVVFMAYDEELSRDRKEVEKRSR